MRAGPLPKLHADSCSLMTVHIRTPPSPLNFKGPSENQLCASVKETESVRGSLFTFIFNDLAERNTPVINKVQFQTIQRSIIWVRMGAFIAKMLLPTISSLVFLPAASVAAKRGFHMEAMVYFFTMFFIAVRE